MTDEKKTAQPTSSPSPQEEETLDPLPWMADCHRDALAVCTAIYALAREVRELRKALPTGAVSDVADAVYDGALQVSRG